MQIHIALLFHNLMFSISFPSLHERASAGGSTTEQVKTITEEQRCINSECGQYRVLWSEHRQLLCTYVAGLLNNMDSADVMLVAKGGVSVSAHKLVLGAASPMLRTILQVAIVKHSAVNISF